MNDESKKNDKKLSLFEKRMGHCKTFIHKPHQAHATCAQRLGWWI